MLVRCRTHHPGRHLHRHHHRPDQGEDRRHRHRRHLGGVQTGPGRWHHHLPDQPDAARRPATVDADQDGVGLPDRLHQRRPAHPDPGQRHPHPVRRHHPDRHRRRGRPMTEWCVVDITVEPPDVTVFDATVVPDVVAVDVGLIQAGGSSLPTGTNGQMLTLNSSGAPDWTWGSQPMFNALDWNIVADGTTDNLANMNALHAAALAAGPGSRVWYPPGVYAFNGALSNVSSVEIVGYGATWKKTGSNVATKFADIPTSSDGLIIRGVTFDGNGIVSSTGVAFIAGSGAGTAAKRTMFDDCVWTGMRSGTGVLATRIRDGVDGVLFRRCRWDGVGTAVYTDGNVDNIAFTDQCRIRNWVNRGMYWVGTTTGRCRNIRVEDVTITELAQTTEATPQWGSVRQPFATEGDATFPHDGFIVTHGIARGPGKSYNDPATPGTADQWSFHRTVNFTVTDTISTDGGDCAFAIGADCRQFTISGCVGTRTDTAGLALGASGTSVYDGVVGDNVFMNNGQNRNNDRNNRGRVGIWLWNAHNIVVGDNQLGDNQTPATQQHGLFLNTCDNVTIGEVSTSGVGVSSILDEGGNTNISRPNTAPQTDTFTASGTWTKPLGAVRMRLRGCGGGGGSASGGRRGTGVVAPGGGTGSPAPMVEVWVNAADCSATEAVTIGAAGVGGAAVTTDDTNGIAGTAGGDTAFGPSTGAGRHMFANGGNAPGTVTPTTSPAGAAIYSYAAAGSAAGANGGVGVSGNASGGKSSVWSAGSGGSGGGITTGNVANSGGNGSSQVTGVIVVPAAGVAPGGRGTDAQASRSPQVPMQPGGGGAGGAANTTGPGGDGGVGGFPGGSGGGGGASRNGFNSGKGGDGAGGMLQVTTYFN